MTSSLTLSYENKPIIDYQQCIKSAEGDQQYLDIIFEKFQTSLNFERLVSDIHGALLKQKWKLAYDQVYEIKGSVGYVGAFRLMNVCDIFGSTLHSKNEDQVFACYILFINECKQFRIEIDKITNRDTINELIIFYDALIKTAEKKQLNLLQKNNNNNNNVSSDNQQEDELAFHQRQVQEQINNTNTFEIGYGNQCICKANCNIF